MREFARTIGLVQCAVDWPSQGDEWMHHFGQSLGAIDSRFEEAGVSMDESTRPFIEIALRREGKPIDAVVRLGVMPGALEVLYADDENQPDSEVLVDVLRTAASTATSFLGRSGTAHEWHAIVGARQARAGGNECRLAKPGDVGPVKVESTEVVFTEPDTSMTWSLSGWASQRSVPIAVSGSSMGYHWMSAASQAARDLRTVCGLLGVAWNEILDVRVAAMPGDSAIHIADAPPWYKPRFADESRSKQADLRTRSVEVPEWMPRAWEEVERNAWLRNALDAYLEGTHVRHRHASLAAVAFVASIETLARELYRIPRCTECKSPHGIAKSFRCALGVVLDHDEVQALVSAYTDRSLTVHEGRLHGRENSPGSVDLNPFRTDSPLLFEWDLLSRLQAAARKLLLLALTDGLPERTALP